jgi:hypothetical protein
MMGACATSMLVAGELLAKFLESDRFDVTYSCALLQCGGITIEMSFAIFDLHPLQQHGSHVKTVGAL